MSQTSELSRELLIPAMAWIYSLPHEYQGQTGGYYSRLPIAAEVFHSRISQRQLDRSKGDYYRQEVKLYDDPETGVNAEASLRIALQSFDRLNFILLKGRIPSRVVEGGFHAVALKIDRVRGLIEHQDPQGDEIYEPLYRA